MTTFTLQHHTAKLFCVRCDKSGLYEIAATGVFTINAMRSMTDQVFLKLQPASAMVVRFDSALIAFDFAQWPTKKRNPGWPLAVAFVVSQDTHDNAVALCKTLSEEGLIRAVFLPSQSRLAYRWASRHAGLARQAAPE